jgi:uncharacterized UPF0160 family protein
VGDVYDVDKMKFDHHQKSFATRWSPESPTLLSSAGLVWLHFGKNIIRTLCSSESDVEELHNKFYYDFILAIDARDNNVQAADEPKFSDNTTLGATVKLMNNADDKIAAFQKALDHVTCIGKLHLMSAIHAFKQRKQDVELLRVAIINASETNLGVVYAPRYVDEHHEIINELEHELDCIVAHSFFVFYNETEDRYIMRTIVTTGQKVARYKMSRKKQNGVVNRGWIAFAPKLEHLRELARMSIAS